MVLLTKEDIIESYNQGKPLDFIFFWGGYLSNWFESSFVIEGVRYFCVEQYMMAMKAKIFNDITILQEIMKSNDQREIKRLGRKVKNYDENTWVNEREKVVFDGNFAQFTQNEKLKNYLLSTNESILVEASPSDEIWGIKMSREDEGVKNPNNWQGSNLLGFVLMAVREKIRNGGV